MELLEINNTARNSLNQTGPVTAAIATCGAPGTKTNVETWNGSSWTEVGDLNAAKR